MKQYLIGILFFCNASFAVIKVLKHDSQIQYVRYDKVCEKLIYYIKKNTKYHAIIYDLKLEKITDNYLIFDKPIDIKLNPKNQSVLVYQKNKEVYLEENGKVVFKRPTTLKTPDKQIFFGKNSTKFFNYHTPVNEKLTKDNCEDNYYQVFDIETKKSKEFGISSTIYKTIVDYTGEHLILCTSKGLYHCDSEGKLTFLNDNQYAVLDESEENIIFFDAETNTFKRYNFKQYKITNTLKVEKAIVGDFLVTDNNKVIFTYDNHYFHMWNIDKDCLTCIHYFVEKYGFFQAAFSYNDTKKYYFSQTEALNKKSQVVRDVSNIICFSSTEKKETKIYDAKTDNWVAIGLSIEDRGFLKIDSHKKYAVYYSYASNKAYLYCTKSWKKIREWSVEGSGIVRVTFSPCGNFIEISYQKKKDDTSLIGLLLYAIKKDKILVNGNYHRRDGLKPVWDDHYFTFVKKDLKTLCMINCKKGYFHDGEFNSNINNVIISEDCTFVFSGTNITQYY